MDRRLLQEAELLNNYLHKSTRFIYSMLYNACFEFGWISCGVKPFCDASLFVIVCVCVCVLICRRPLILCVEKQLIGEHLQEILDKGMCIYTVY